VNDKIERGLLRPGDRLPSERELAALIGVSRPSVRSGLRTLSAMGIVQTRHGSGTYITEGPPALDGKPLRVLAALHGMSPEQMFEARCVLEVGAAGLAAERATGEHIAAMAEEVSGMFATVDDPHSFLMHDIRFHRAVAMASGNPILASLVEMVSGLFFELRRHVPQRTPDQLREIAIIHRNIYHAVRARDPERARREMGSHLPRMRPVDVEARRG
jgi:GntR family transcriptional repressor for pyruvate dehydrogenase complex